jgi:hypothetical protein
MRLALVLAAALLSMALLAPAVDASDEVPGAEAAKAKKKRKGCRKKKVAVTINGRRRCRPLKAALPRPKAADQRQLAAQAALHFDPGRARDRRGRRTVSVSKLLGPKKTKTAEKAVRLGLATLDRLSKRRALSSIGPPPGALASAPRGCGHGPAGHPELQSSYRGSGFDAQVSLDQGAAQIGVDIGESGVRAELDFGLCEAGGDKFKVPDCPDSQGELEASDETRFFVSIKIFKGGAPLLSQGYDFVGETEIKPIQVDDDAKLEYFEVEHRYQTSTVLGGSSQAFGRISFRMRYHGSTRVTFPGANYDPTHTDVDVHFDIEGAQADELHEVRDLEFDESLKAKREADKNFAAEVDKAISRITAKEEVWQQPNKCAQISFEPAKNSLKLKRDQGGTFRAKLDSRSGGSPSGAKWTRLEAQNATVSPASALANPATFSYRVTSAGQGVDVAVNLKAVSQAGVAEEKWIQPTEQDSINTISGTFTWRTEFFGSVFEAAGNATFLRWTPAIFGGASGGYKLASGLFTFTASGNASQLVTDKCSMKGSGQFALQKDTEFAVFSKSAQNEGEPPYEYSFGVASGGFSELPMIEIETYACSPEADEYNGKKFPYPATFGVFTSTPYTSVDGISYVDSFVSEEPNGKFTETWSFKGAP